MITPISRMEDAHRRDSEQERALGVLLQAFHDAKRVYAQQDAAYPDRLLKAELLIAREREVIQAVWN